MNKMDAHSQKMEAKVNELQKQIINLEREAKMNLQKSQQSKGSAKEMYKQKCMMALKKKKGYENQMKQYMSKQAVLDQAKFNMENMNSHKEMAEHMSAAVYEQKKAMEKLDIDKMDDLHDQMIDMKYESDYMNEMMNRNYQMDDVDEDDLDDELMEFEKEIATEKKQQQKQPQQINKNVSYQSRQKDDIADMLK